MAEKNKAGARKPVGHNARKRMGGQKVERAIQAHTGSRPILNNTFLQQTLTPEGTRV